MIRLLFLLVILLPAPTCHEDPEPERDRWVLSSQLVGR